MSFSRLLTCFFCLFYFVTGFASSVDEFVRTQPKIRILCDGGDGYGNQTASLNVINRLRQMGYTGSFEFIYPVVSAEKIKTLFDLPKNISGDYYDNKQNIRFLDFKEYANQVNQNRIESLALGMSGSFYGDFCSLAKADGANVQGWKLCKNTANAMLTEKFIVLSPFTYRARGARLGSKFDTDIFTKNQAKPVTQKGSDSKFIVMPTASLQDTKNYLMNDSRGKELLAKKPGLQTLIHGIENQSFNVMPVYGYPVQYHGHCEANDTEDECMFNRLTNMLQIILGARHAQLNHASELQKPLVIPVFYNYAAEAKTLLKLLTQDWHANNPKSQIGKKRIKDANLTQQFSITNLDDVTSAQQIQNLAPNQILLVSMGSLPKIVFDGLFTHTNPNVWPQIREGANSFNSLLLTGKPHFRCGGGWEIGFSLVQDQTLKNKLEQFYYGFCYNWDSWEKNNDVITQLGDLILESTNAQSALSQYFVFLKQHALKPENDRIYYALETVIK